MAKLKLNIPVKRGDRLELDVETLASSGDGLCRHEGYTLFTPGGLPGDRVRGKVIKTTPRFGVVDVFERTELSKDRVDPPCPVFFKCGGCKFQDLSYEKQLEFKIQVVRDSFSRIGGIKLPEKIEAFGADRQYHYRNKGSFAVQGKTSDPQIGFYSEGSHDVADSPVCDILLEPINKVKEWLRQLLKKNQISIYHEQHHRGLVRGLVIRHSESTGETLVGIITNDGRFPRSFLEELTEEKKLKELGVVGLIQNINPKPTNVILGKENKILWGKERLTDKLGDVSFHLSLGSFFQIHPEQTLQLYNLIETWADTAKDKTIVDAYSGSGGIALWLAAKGKKVIAIEQFAPAMEDARLSAETNGVTDCQFLAGNVEEHAPRVVSEEDVHTFIIDPPRKGCSESVIKTLLESKPKQIIYISCNPSTLARDLERLEGYSIQDMRVIDMFPQTHHIETAVLLQRETKAT
ncbi:MAG: 23S rRNA (uracil(1939)-C(5))-methyltransferase RlmD [Nitrospinae bacterium]|nr:23S rRNA (uracil(1939)-C(5))-methyltransferase RlmD [Nitrospinota bacterium]